MKWIAAFILCFGLADAFCQDTTYIQKFRLGDNVIQIYSACFKPCDDKVLYINLHDNENTSIEAVRDILSKTGGTLTQLKHSGERNISFQLNNSKYTFDPNRIFTANGIKITLIDLSRYKPEAAKLVNEFATQIVRSAINGRNIIVALHNNTDGNYSIESYKKGQPEAINASKVYINPEMDADDFIFTTESSIFDTLKARKINVVLQNNRTAKDDGSLSVYAGRNKIPYINVEAEAGHIEEQKAMLQAISDIVKRE